MVPRSTRDTGHGRGVTFNVDVRLDTSDGPERHLGACYSLDPSVEPRRRLF